MTHFLRMMCWTGLLAAAAAAAGFAFVYLSPYYDLFSAYGPNQGSHAHGWELMGALYYYGIPGAAFYILGLIGSLALRHRQDSSFLRLYGKLSLGLLLFALLVLGANYAMSKLVDSLKVRRQRDAEAAKAILDDPARFEAYVESARDINAPLPGSAETPLDAAVARGYPDVMKKIVAKGALISEGSFEWAARKGDLETAAYLWDHGKGLTGQDALLNAFISGQSDLLRELVSMGIKPDPLLRRLCVYEFFHAYEVGQPYSAFYKKKDVSKQMFLLLARKAGDKSGEQARGTLLISVYARDVETVRMLLDSGFDVHALDGRLSRASLLTQDPEVIKTVQDEGETLQSFNAVLSDSSLPKNKDKERLMEEFLTEQGLRWRP